MIRTERGDEARKIATEFIEKQPCNEWSPRLAIELSKIENPKGARDYEGDSTELEIWVKYFEDQGCDSLVAGFLELRHSLFRAYMDDWDKREQSIATGTTLLELMKEAGDKMFNDDNSFFTERDVQNIADEIEITRNYLQKRQDLDKRRMQEIEEKKIADKRRARLRIIGLIIIGVIPIGLFFMALLRKKH